MTTDPFPRALTPDDDAFTELARITAYLADAGWCITNSSDTPSGHVWESPRGDTCITPSVEWYEPGVTDSALAIITVSERVSADLVTHWTVHSDATGHAPSRTIRHGVSGETAVTRYPQA